MYQFVSLEGVTLREAHGAVLALVGLLAGVRAQVALQLERVWGRVGAVRALEEQTMLPPEIYILKFKTFTQYKINETFPNLYVCDF